MRVLSTLGGKHGLLLISGRLAKSLMRSIPLPLSQLIIITVITHVRKYRSCQIGNDNTTVDQLEPTTGNKYFFHKYSRLSYCFYCALPILLYNLICVISISISSCFIFYPNGYTLLSNCKYYCNVKRAA